jgi:hypothetical protein
MSSSVKCMYWSFFGSHKCVALGTQSALDWSLGGNLVRNTFCGLHCRFGKAAIDREDEQEKLRRE